MVCIGRTAGLGVNGVFRNGAPEEIRTPDPQIRSLVLYPAELRARFEGANLLGSLPKGKDNPSQLGTPPRFPASISGNVQISPRSGIVIPCPLPPRWLRLRPVSAINPGGRGWAPDLFSGLWGPGHRAAESMMRGIPARQRLKKG